MSEQRVKKSFTNRLCFLCLATAILLLSSSLAQAATYTWADPSTTGDWSATASWGGIVPTGADYAYIANGGTANITLPGATCLNLYVGNTGAVGTGSGYVNMTAGTLNVTTTSFSPALIGGTNNGQFDLSGGTATFGFGFTLGGSTSAYSSVTGTFNLSSNAVLNATGAENIGQYGIGNFTQYNGTNNATGKNIILGYYGTGVGTYDIRDGSVTANTIYAGFNSSGNGTVKQSGGLITLASTTGLKLAANSGTASGTYYLTGGTLNLKALSKGTGTAAFNFGGGTLKAGDTFTSSLDMNLSGIGSNPLITYNATVDTNNVPVTLSGILSGVGGLNKVGSGTLTLSNASNYGGPTTVYQGTLLVNGSLTSAVTANLGSTIGGSGSVGGLNVLSGATLSVGTSPGTMTVNGNVTLSGDDLVQIWGAAAGTGYDQLVVHGGTTTLGGTLTLDLDSFTPGSSDKYWIILNDDSTTLSGSFSGLADGDLVGSTGLHIYYSADYATGNLSGGNDVLLQVPEPATFVLLITACLAMLGYAGRQYRRKS